jgi:hypothetical protein
VSPEEWSAIVRQQTDPEAGLDRHTLETVVRSLRNRAAGLPNGGNNRPWFGAADHVAEMIEKGKP